MRSLTFVLLVIVLSGCGQTTTNGQADTENDSNLVLVEETPEHLIKPEYKPFDRSVIKSDLKSKIEKGEPLIVHIMIPLCDNFHQGIVPVNDQLGDGMNLRTNLYWGAGYGVKTHFSRSADWKQIYNHKDVDSNILERVVFEKTFENNAKVILIADAFRGDRMLECLEYFFRSLSGEMLDSFIVNESTFYTNSGADLLAFNGHNGLMDTDVDLIVNKDGKYRDAVVIACASDYYFDKKLNYVNAYPLVTTTNLLAPEAYVIKAVIESWALQKTEEEIRLSAGDAYHNIQQCGQRGARALFRTGWVE
jgi:hypothetical protein